LDSFAYEVVVIDDASSDATKDLSRDGVCVIHNSEQLMMVKSRNKGIEKTTGTYIVFIDDDNVVAPSMIKNLVSFASSNTNYGIVGPCMYYASSKTKYLDFQTFNFYTGKTTGRVDTSDNPVCKSHGIPNVFLIKRTVFDQCGHFDASLIQTFTEPDYSFRAASHGFKCGIVKNAKTFHAISPEDNLSPRALGGMYKQKAYCLMRNRTLLVKRYGTPVQKFIYITCFSWLWPLIYSLLIYRTKRYDLIALYWRGFKDGMIYFFTGKLTSSI